MKRVLAQGCSQIFQICPCFRKGERGRLHQEEFTMLEWYHTEWSYLELMKECEQMIQQVAGKDSICRSGRRISLVAPWQRLTVNDAFRCYAGMSAQEAVDTGRFDMLLVEKVEPELGWESPVFSMIIRLSWLHWLGLSRDFMNWRSALSSILVVLNWRTAFPSW